VIGPGQKMRLVYQTEALACEICDVPLHHFAEALNDRIVAGQSRPKFPILGDFP
jgi:hypothetical protein